MTTYANVTFSSWPRSAFVAGEKIAGSSGWLSTHPPGSGSPARVPARRYSDHADPDRNPRTTHSNGSGVVRRTSMARPAIASRWSARAGTRATISSGAAVSKWCGIARASRRNQKALSWVSTAPLCGTGSRSTTSNALTRSLATIKSASWSTS